MTYSLQALQALGPREGADVETAAKALESYFLRNMLKEVSAFEGAMFQGPGSATFKDMFLEALADSMAEGGGFGIAERFRGELGGPGGAAGGVGPAGAGKLVSPLAHGVISSSFGPRTDPIEGDTRFHSGIDLAAPEGTLVRSAGAGVVRRAGHAGGYGNLVVIDHGGGIETRYAHLGAIAVEPGDRIAAGEVLGEVGHSGRATGPHLHLEVRRNGQAVDPRGEIRGLGEPEVFTKSP